MKNIALAFDFGGDASTETLFGLLEESDEQLGWFHCGDADKHRDGRAATRTAISAAYEFLSQTWDPGDAIFVFGAGRGGYCAHALTRLLGTVGVLPEMWSELVDFVLDAYAMPRTDRTARDWWRVRQLIGDLNGGVDIAVPVAFLGTWDAVCAQGLPTPPDDAPANVAAARHALALDGVGPSRQIVPTTADGLEVAWFRGGHCDLVGGSGACEPLTGIAVDWILDGALAAGARPTEHAACVAPAPDHADALAGTVHGMAWRTPADDAAVHASVEVYLQAHPEYWKRLPSRIVWVDAEWIARSERLVTPSMVDRLPAAMAVLAPTAS